MTTEDDFHRALDAHPEDWQTRLVFADFLQERGDPRAEGYRALGVCCSGAVRSEPDESNDWTFYLYSERPFVTSPECWYRSAILPDDWFLLLEGGEQRRGGRPYKTNPQEWLDWSSRREAEDAAALAFLKLPAERRAELLATQPVGAA